MESFFLDAEKLREIALLLAPGFLILGIRARFKEGAVPDLKDQVISYAAVSAVYYAAMTPLFNASGPFELFSLPSSLWGLLYYFVTPSLVAILIVFADQHELVYRLAGKLGWKIKHHIPTAWDYAFSNLQGGEYVLVKLNDGNQLAGRLSAHSYASSSSGERDLYLSEMWQLHEDRPWERIEPPRGVLLCGKDIQTVEILEK